MDEIIIFRKSTAMRICGFQISSFVGISSVTNSLGINAWGNLVFDMHNHAIELLTIAEDIIIEIKHATGMVYFVDAFMIAFNLDHYNTSGCGRARFHVRSVDTHQGKPQPINDPIAAYDRAMGIVGKR